MPVYAAAGVAVLVLASLAFKFLSDPPATGSDAEQTAPAASVAADDSPAPLPTVSALAAGAPSGGASSAAAVTPAPKRAAVKPPVEKAVVARPAVFSPVAVVSPPVLPLEQSAAAQGGPTHPKQACENRVLLGFQSCMNEQCARQRFQNHPTCVERREQDKQRQEIRDGRQ